MDLTWENNSEKSRGNQRGNKYINGKEREEDLYKANYFIFF